MITVTKEFKQMLQEVFVSRCTTEISVDDLVDILPISQDEIKEFLKTDQIKREFGLVETQDGALCIKYLIQGKIEVKPITNTFNIQWDNLGGCPCFTCHELVRCDIGNSISSVDCPLFSKWLFNPTNEEKK